MEAARLKKDGLVKRIVITGCLAQRYSEELAESLPEADLVVGFQNYGSLSASLRDVLGAVPDIDMDEYTQRSRVQVGEATVAFRPEWDRHRLTPPHTAYLRVAEGCNHACTFCAIPSFRQVDISWKLTKAWVLGLLLHNAFTYMHRHMDNNQAW
jgi:ribosomal protein S12 methylthiotransferase